MDSLPHAQTLLASLSDRTVPVWEVIAVRASSATIHKIIVSPAQERAGRVEIAAGAVRPRCTQAASRGFTWRSIALPDASSTIRKS
jgi:hypothetical protein